MSKHLNLFMAVCSSSIIPFSANEFAWVCLWDFLFVCFKLSLAFFPHPTSTPGREAQFFRMCYSDNELSAATLQSLTFNFSPSFPPLPFFEEKRGNETELKKGGFKKS